MHAWMPDGLHGSLAADSSGTRMRLVAQRRCLPSLARRWLMCGLALIASVVFADESEPQAAARAPRPPIGDKIAAISFKDVRYLPRSLRDLLNDKDRVPKRVIALVFTSSTCPLAQKYWPRLKELDQQYRGRGVQLVAVNVGPADTILEMAAQAVQYEVEFPLVKDMDGNCVRGCGVRRTPEVVLLDAELRLRYRGRIDDQYRLGGTAPQVTHHDLRDAIEDLLADREIKTPETTVDGCPITLPNPLKPATGITFYRHVSPLLEKHCQQCHQPGTAAPFALVSYEEVAAQAEAIAEAVSERRMPPWYASDKFGMFANCRALADQDRETILGWIRGGMSPGEHAPTRGPVVLQARADDTRQDRRPERTWLMGEPDLVVSAPGTYSAPAQGYVDYKYALLPYVFLQDTWIQGAEILPDNPRVLHHCNLGFLSAGDRASRAKLITGYVPGGGPLMLGDGVAVKIQRGSVVGLQIHLTTTGKPETCGLRVGFRFARERIQKQLRYLEISHNSFTIPPFAAFHPVAQSRTIDQDITLFGLFAHMHVRGKDITFRAFPPGGEMDTMLMIPNYNFDWQMPYYLPPGQIRYPAKTRFECLAHFDNSSFNPFNPDPSAEVQVGEQTDKEMMYGFVFYVVDAEQLNLAVDANTGRAMKE